MKINRNMPAVMTNKSLLRTENRLQATMKRLSSGYKLNSAKDNPAGMAISNKMKAQIDGLDQAKQNVENGISVLQIADGALQEVTNILQRMRELAVQGASDTNTYEDRMAIQKEINQLKEAVNQISDSTEFNTKKLLDGSSDVRVYADGVSRMNVSNQVLPGKYEFTVETIATQAKSTISFPGSFGPDDYISINGVAVNLTEDMTERDFQNEVYRAAAEAGVTVEMKGGAMELTSTLYGTKGKVDIGVSASLAGIASGELEEDGENYILRNEGKNAVISELKVAEDNKVGFTKNATWSADGNRITIVDSNGVNFDFLMKDGQKEVDGKVVDKTGLKDGSVVEMEVTDIGDMTIQIGANEFQATGVRIHEVSIESLYLDTVDVSVVGGGDAAITTIDKAISQLLGTRSEIGAFQNRMDYAESSLAATGESMTAAYSRIMDADMAYEMTEYAQINVLDQATISVLSQANDLPQQILSLLS